MISPASQPKSPFSAVLQSVGDGVLITDAVGKVTLLNPVAERLTGWTTAEAFGLDSKLVLDLMGETSRKPVDSPVDRVLRDGVEVGLTNHTILHRQGGARLAIENSGTPVRDERGDLSGVVMVFRDVSDRRPPESGPREQGDTPRRIVEGSPDGILTLDADGHILTLNESGRVLVGGVHPASASGADWLSFQDGDGLVAARDALRAARAGDGGRFQVSRATGTGEPRWWDVIVTPLAGAGGSDGQLLVSARDITDGKEAGDIERAQFAEIFLQTPSFMGVARGREHIFEMVNLPYHRLVGLGRELIGRSVAVAIPEATEQGFIAKLDAVFQTGEPFTAKYVRVMLETTPEEPLEEHFLDFAYLPLRDRDGTVSGILIHGIDLTERKRWEQERERLIEERRVVAEHELILKRISAAVRATDDSIEMKAKATALLSEALDLSLCHAAIFEPAHEAWHVAHDWRREGLPSLAGIFPTAMWRSLSGAAMERGVTSVFSDVANATALSPDTRTLFAQMEVTAFVNVPFLNAAGDTIGGMSAGRTGTPRDWTTGEVVLIEATAALMRAAVDSARLHAREHNIAVQLQDILLPPLPETVPGLALSGFYKPALAEAAVGGDFLAAYSLGGDLSALCVGDLSGKGLAAARTVSVVTNSLRYALRNAVRGVIPGGTDAGTAASGEGGCPLPLAATITEVNRILVDDLLTNFATLFVAVYDAGSRTLTYVNCGQEPTLLWRAGTGTVELLPATGPVLGGFDTAAFQQASVTLADGDVLAAFTDGLTEAGPNHKNLLRIEGVAELFRRVVTRAGGQDVWSDGTPGTVGDAISAHLIAGVDDFAGTGARDDIALLVAVARGRSPA